MKTTGRTTVGSAPLHHPPVQRALGTTRSLLGAYGALSAVVFTAVAVLALSGRAVTPFMWGRAAGVLGSAVVTYWLAVRASRGARWAYVRVRVISVVVPFVIIGIDTVPGVLPAWFVMMQAACALALGASAFLVNGSRLRAAFPKTN
ncbi:hypothetical protein [Streptomyces sp. NPDC048611]|uniref:hypothetical protein n=1 Tax=Streptomyces sp. NPDC048611 TaxID=3155635 RepID=UPI00342797E2